MVVFPSLLFIWTTGVPMFSRRKLLAGNQEQGSARFQGCFKPLKYQEATDIAVFPLTRRSRVSCGSVLNALASKHERLCKLVSEYRRDIDRVLKQELGPLYVGLRRLPEDFSSPSARKATTPSSVEGGLADQKTQTKILSWSGSRT